MRAGGCDGVAGKARRSLGVGVSVEWLRVCSGAGMSAEGATKLARAQVQSLRAQVQRKRAALRDTDGGALVVFFLPIFLLEMRS